MSQKIDSKRIAKNTIFLYFRMIVVMLVSLYTTRVVLEILGEKNYGIYNIVGGIVVLFSFLNNSLTTATQRFLSYALGQENIDYFNKIFNNSIICYTIISLIIITLSETVGLWFVNTQLSIPQDRYFAANIVYQMTILTFIVSIIKVPFESIIIATERMSFYAYLSIIESLLKLGAVGILVILRGDKLIDYSILMMFVALGCMITTQLYCQYIVGCKIKFDFDKQIFKDLFGYTSWSMLGGVANVMAKQGGNILMNMFFGVVINAAFGIASQINNAVSSLVGSFQTAFRPQITKLYAAAETKQLQILICRTSRFSFYLTLILFIPLGFNIYPILRFWLSSVPDYTPIFSILLLSYCSIDAIQGPLIMLIYAHRDIKNYQLWLSSLIILNLPISYFLLKLGAPAPTVLTVSLILNLISAIIRTIYVKSFSNFAPSIYIKYVIVRSVFVLILSILLCSFINHIIPHYGYMWLLSCVIYMVIVGLSILLVGLDRQEKQFLNMKINYYFNKLLAKLTNKGGYIDQISMGSNCRLINCTCSSEPYLVKLGNHVSATRTHFETHDGAVWIFREDNPDWDIIKPIRIGNNVYIGTGSVILPGVTIGNNVIIGAGSVVTKDIPSNTVYAGVPAKFIKTIEEYKNKIQPTVHMTKKMAPADKKEFYTDLYYK